MNKLFKGSICLLLIFSMMIGQDVVAYANSTTAIEEKTSCCGS